MASESKDTVDEGPNDEVNMADDGDNGSKNSSKLKNLKKSNSTTQSGTLSRRPKDSAFRQQRLPAWQPILSPHNVIPSLFVLALIFIPIGVVIMIFSGQVQEYKFDYTTCLQDASLNVFEDAPGKYGNVPFKWRKVSFPVADLPSDTDNSKTICEIQFAVEKEMKGPVFQYYRLQNYYQNQRMYVKSVDWQQLRGEAKTKDELVDCSPLAGPDDGSNLVYYPCGLIANSMFSDTFGPLVSQSKQVYSFPPKDITWSTDHKKYGPTKYSLSQIRPPPFWINNTELVNPDGTYKKIPELYKDERFQNWMKVAGLPVFRKTYGKHLGNIPVGTYNIAISSTYEVASYGARKSIVIANTSWLGGKNSFLGWAYLVTGGVFVLLALIFLAKQLIAPRRLGDPRYLSWTQSK